MFAILLLLTSATQAAPATNPPQDRVRTMEDIVIEAGQTAGDVQCFVCSVRVAGHMTGDIVVVDGSVIVDGTVDGNVITCGGRIHVGSSGRIDGDAISVGGYLTQDTRAALEGDKISAPYVLIPGQYRPTLLGSFALAGLNLLFVALAFAALRFKRVENTSNVIRCRVGLVLLVGLAAIPLTYALFALSDRLGRSGVIVESGLAVLFVLIAAAGAAGLGFRVAKLAFPNTTGIGTTLAGILALTLLELVPLLGAFVFLTGLVLSMGAAIVSGFGWRGFTGSSPTL